MVRRVSRAQGPKNVNKRKVNAYRLAPIKIVGLVCSRRRKKKTEKLFLTVWYADIKNVLIKSCYNLVKKNYGQRRITDIFTIDVNKVVYLIRCHAVTERTVVILQAIKPMGHWCHCLSRRLGIYLVMAYQSMTKTLLIQCHLMSLKKRHGWLNTKRFGMRLSHSYLKNWRQNW